MSKETLEWLNNNTLVGFTEKRGTAWHYRAGNTNHYEGPVPMDDVRSRLFDWKPVIVPIAGDFGGEYVPFNGKVGVFRSDTKQGLGIFGEDYPETDYEDRLITPVANIVDTSEGELACGSAGLLEGGAVAWFQIELPETVETPEGFDVRPFLLATSSLNGKVSTTFKLGATAVVCDNTLTMALSERGHTHKVKNTKNSPLRLGEARDALDIIFKLGDAYTEEIKKLAETVVTDKQWFDFLDAYEPLPEEKGRGYTVAEKKRDELCLIWNKDERAAQWHGTALGVYQTANTWNQHYARVNNSDTVARAERNFNNFLMGKTAQQDSDAMNKLQLVLSNA